MATGKHYHLARWVKARDGNEYLRFSVSIYPSRDDAAQAIALSGMGYFPALVNDADCLTCRAAPQVNPNGRRRKSYANP